MRKAPAYGIIPFLDVGQSAYDTNQNAQKNYPLIGFLPLVVFFELFWNPFARL
jgi:hypothetical protein